MDSQPQNIFSMLISLIAIYPLESVITLWTTGPCFCPPENLQLYPNVENSTGRDPNTLDNKREKREINWECPCSSKKQNKWERQREKEIAYTKGFFFIYYSLWTADSISHSARTESGSEFKSVKETWKPFNEQGPVIRCCISYDTLNK